VADLLGGQTELADLPGGETEAGDSLGAQIEVANSPVTCPGRAWGQQWDLSNMLIRQ